MTLQLQLPDTKSEIHKLIVLEKYAALFNYDFVLYFTDTAYDLYLELYDIICDYAKDLTGSKFFWWDEAVFSNHSLADIRDWLYKEGMNV